MTIRVTCPSQANQRARAAEMAAPKPMPAAPSRALVTRLGFRVHREDVTPSGVGVLVHELFAP
jgi:hypothetical protein